MLEQDDSLVRSDQAVLYAAVRDAAASGRLTYEHVPARHEPLLWAADTAACAGRAAPLARPAAADDQEHPHPVGAHLGPDSAKPVSPTVRRAAGLTSRRYCAVPNKPKAPEPAGYPARRAHPAPSSPPTVPPRGGMLSRAACPSSPAVGTPRSVPGRRPVACDAAAVDGSPARRCWSRPVAGPSPRDGSGGRRAAGPDALSRSRQSRRSRAVRDAGRSLAPGA